MELSRKLQLILKSIIFPIVSGKEILLATGTKVYLKARKGQEITEPDILLKGESFETWDNFPAGAVDGNMKESTGDVSVTPIGEWVINAGVEGLDKEELEDIFILMKYSAT